MTSQYEHPIPALRAWNDGAGWKTEGPPGEGLTWLVEVVEPDPREGTYDVYVVADIVEVNEGRLELSLRARTGELEANIPPRIAFKCFAPGVWREYHLVSSPHAIAEHAAEMFKEEGDE